MTSQICIGIESTADNLGVGILDAEGNILANVITTHVPMEGGIHPREAARHHSDVMGDTISKALNNAEIDSKDIDFISFSQGPGLGPCLRTGATAARALSAYLKVPLVGVNHCVAHIEIGRLVTGAEDPLTLYVSGGNTIITGYEAGRYRIFGETIDIAIGKCLDTFARQASLPYPGGPAVEKLALNGKNLIMLPYVVKGMDLSYSGLLTASILKYREKPFLIEDLCYSIQETAYAMLGEVTERALAHTKKSEVLLTGGVGANKRLRDIVREIAWEHGVTPHFVPITLAMDNGAMIAWTGILAYSCGIRTPINTSFIDSNWRLDKVEVPWRS